MKSICRRAAGVWFGLGAALCAGQAAAKPDFVVSREDTRIVFGGCGVEDPLAEGRAAIKNIGDERGKLPLGILDRYTRSLVAVYVPEHLDMLDHGRATTALDPGEQAVVEFEIGVDSIKAGRLVRPAEAVASSSDLAPIETMGLDAIRRYQQSLAELGYYTAKIDGIPGPGFRAAVEAFQARVGRPQTGALTVGEARQLGEMTERSLPTGPTAGGLVSVTVYVVVDPYNFIDEDDETNNIQVWNGVIDCGDG